MTIQKITIEGVWYFIDGIKDTDVDVIVETETEVVIIPHKENYEKSREAHEAAKAAESTTADAIDLLARLKAKRN